jgi:hypothetical protein
LAISQGLLGFSREGAKRKRKHQRAVGQLLSRLRRCSQNGFENYEGSTGPIRPEWDGVFRIGYVDDLFRIIGFYEGDLRTDFIAIDCLEKGGQKLSAAEKKRINKVALVKKRHLWKRRNDGKFPRLAQCP